MSLLSLLPPAALAAAVSNGPIPRPDFPASLCRMQREAVLPLRNAADSLTTVGSVNGEPLSLIVDTGSEGSLITPEGMARLSLSPDPTRSTLIQGPNGAPHLSANVRIGALTLGRLSLKDISVPVGALPSLPLLRPPVLGLLGADVLAGYDVELDLPRQRLSFWSVKLGSALCRTPPHWPSASWRALEARQQDGRLLVSFALDGVRGTALVDSGARSTIVSTDFAHRLGLTDDRLALDPGGISAGIDLNERRYHWHRFRTLRIGGSDWAKPVLTVAPVHEKADLLLGSDWFSQKDVWLSYGTNRIFIRTGGREDSSAGK